jgi:uncharacterized membrane protein
MAEEKNQGAPAMLPPKHNTVLGVLAYIGPLVIVSYLVGKEDSFVKFHVRQGLVLFVIEVVLWLIQLSFFIPVIGVLFGAIRIGIVVLAVIGIMNAVKGGEKELPLVGKFAVHFPL